MSVLIAVLGGLSLISMPSDIFPNIEIPVPSVIWSYNGISPDEMSSRITTPFERGLTGTVNDIEHIESSSYTGLSVIRIFFQPNVRIDLAVAQVVALSPNRSSESSRPAFSRQASSNTMHRAFLFSS